MISMLLLRTYYGIDIHSDAHGDLGIVEYATNKFPDLTFVTAATIADQSPLIDLHVIDGNAEELLPDELLDRLEEVYDYIIVKTAAPSINLDLEFVKILRKEYPHARIMLAGHAAKIVRKWINDKVKAVDQVIEMPLDLYMYQFVNGNKDKVEIDDFPTPNYLLFPYDKYTDAEGEKRFCIQASRGCMMRCGYCPYSAFYGDKISFRAVEKIIDDIKQLLPLEPEVIQFRDQYFTADRKRVLELCTRIIEEGIKIKWVCETRIDYLDKELVDIMIQAGLDMICFGVESGNDEILSSFNRIKCNQNSMQAIVDYLNKRQVKTLGFYIIGFPQDTWETAQQTYSYAVKLNSKYAKFSAYEPCVFDDKNEVNRDINPRIFKNYKNEMDLNIDAYLNNDEVEYLVKFFTMMYEYSRDDLHSIYNYHYKNQWKYEKMIKQLIPLGEDLNKLCEVLRKM